MKPISLEPGALGDGVTVRHGIPFPSILDMVCEHCQMDGCRAAAVTGWPDDHERGGVRGYVVGRRCVAAAAALARQRRVDTGRDDLTVEIDLPLWSSADVMRLSGAPYARLNYWTRAGYLVSETGPNPGVGRDRAYLADMVERAFWLNEFTALKVGPAVATVFLDLDTRELVDEVRHVLRLATAGVKV